MRVQRDNRTKIKYINKCIFIILLVAICVMAFVSCKKYIAYDESFEFEATEGSNDFYYRQLSENQQKMYRMINKEAQSILFDGKNKKDLGFYKYSDYGITQEEALTVWTAFYYDAPTFFFISNAYTYGEKGFGVEVSKEFLKKSARQKVMTGIEQCVSEVETLLQGVNQTALKFNIIYDYVMSQTKYKRVSDEDDLFDGYSYSIASVFDKDNNTDTICQGYSKAVSYLCNIFGIECIFVPSEARDHALNIVKIDGEWYYADTTLEDRSTKEEYQFFLKGNDNVWKATIMPGNDPSDNYLTSKLPQLADNDYVLSDGKLKYTITGKDTCNVVDIEEDARSVVVPSYLEYLQVVEIVAVKEIGLASITIPSGIKVCDFAFNIYADNYSNSNLTIFCELSSAPNNWGVYWNYQQYPVVWNCQENGITENGIKWGLTKDGEIEIAGYCGDWAAEVEIPDVINGKKVEKICANAFKKCGGSMASITIPNSVKFIGADAFSDCYGLAIYCKASSKPSGWDDDWNSGNNSVVWGINENGITADGIKWGIKEDGLMMITGYVGTDREVVIPDVINNISVTRINESAFKNNNDLLSVTIPASVTSVGNQAFWGCNNLTVYCETQNKIAEWNYDSFGNTPKVWNCRKNGITADGIKWGLTKDGTMTIAGYCGTAREVVIPNDIEGYSATSICNNAFSGIKELKSVTIPIGVTNVDFNAFNSCAKLTIYCKAESRPSGWDLHWTDSPTVWNCQEFGVTEEGFRWGLTKDGEMIIAGYDGRVLRNVVIPEIINGYRVTGISDRAFARWIELTDITLPNSLKSIGEMAFLFCDKLTKIEIPDSVINIGQIAFESCRELTIYCESESKPSGWDDTWNSSNRPVIWGYKG